MKKVYSFRLEEEVMEKLDRLCDYHQTFIDTTFKASKVEPVKLSRGMILQSLIQERYEEMKQKGVFR